MTKEELERLIKEAHAQGMIDGVTAIKEALREAIPSLINDVCDALINHAKTKQL